MGYETTPFGDGVSTTRVTQVQNHFGARESGGAVGVVKTEGSSNQASFTVSGSDLSAGEFALLTDFKIPAGAVITKAYMKVTEAFVIGGTSATALIGTSGSEATNGIVATEAKLEAVGTYDLTSTQTGTWAANTALAAATTVGLAMGGTSPTSTSAGKAKFVIEYDVVGAA